SREWNSIPADDREKMGLIFRDDGEFWMEFTDFMRNFDSLDVCNLTPDSPVEMPKQWHTAEYHERWMRGFNAGGRPKYRDSHWTNPHFKVTLSDTDEDGDKVCSFIVQLMQKDRRKIKHRGEKLIYIGFLLYRLSRDHTVPLKREFFDTNQSVESSGHFINMRQRIARLSLPPGDYIVVPCTWDQNEEADFYLRFFFENRNAVEEVDEAPVREELPLPSTDKDKEDHFKRFFHSVSGEDMEVSAFELQTALNEALQKEPLHHHLGIQACKSFVALMDVDGSGKLGFTEFLYLWNLLRSWKRLFYQYDVDGSGMLNSFELRRVLGAAGFKVDNSTMRSLVWWYADEKFCVSLDSYFICLARLMKRFNEFSKLKKNEQITLPLSQWLQKGVS
ncbi:calpain-1 catalytic subunit-like, partial [Saccostrea cucullata]|uniref:calpain-1 catalytic subunit-like n=1 Tax=Saccostrea cuccullata TaxID=36930 RepID=UPI002ED2B589